MQPPSISVICFAIMLFEGRSVRKHKLADHTRPQLFGNLGSEMKWQIRSVGRVPGFEHSSEPIRFVHVESQNPHVDFLRETGSDRFGRDAREGVQFSLEYSWRFSIALVHGCIAGLSILQTRQ